MKQAPSIDDVLTPDDVDAPVLDADVSPRVKFSLEDEDRKDIDFILSSIEEQVRREYAQAFEVEDWLLDKVRVKPPMLGGQYAKNPDGSYIEDWEKVSIKDMEWFIQAGSSCAFYCSQNVINSYAEAAYSKFNYDDAFDARYSAMITGTIHDKEARARKQTMEERWVALYKSLYYKRTKEIVDRLDQHVRRVEGIYRERQKEVERNFRAGAR